MFWAIASALPAITKAAQASRKHIDIVNTPFSGYQPLIRAYIGQGLRADLERLENHTVSALIASLKRHGVSDEVIHEALSEVAHG
jgi:hypothetical protein